MHVKYSVEQAERNREGIKNEVQDWLLRANNKATEAQNLDNEVQAIWNHRCSCACCFPGWLSRYNMSKQAVSISKKMGVIVKERSFETVSPCNSWTYSTSTSQSFRVVWIHQKCYERYIESSERWQQQYQHCRGSRDGKAGPRYFEAYDENFKGEFYI